MSTKEQKYQKKTSKIMGVIKNLKFIFLPSSRLNDLILSRQDNNEEWKQNQNKRSFLHKLHSGMTILGIIIVFFVITLAVFADWISPYTYAEAKGIFTGAYHPPSPSHLLGQGAMGRDILARIIFGARTSLSIAFPTIFFSVIFGIIFGMISGYYGGWIDSVIMRISDVFLAFPGLILALVFITILGRRVENIMIAWGILGIPYYARLIRGNVMQARELPYVEGAKVSGANSWRIMFRHILPNVIQPIIISVTFSIGGMILSLAALAYLGFSDTRLVEWGNDISTGRAYLPHAPWASLWPGLMILITVFGFMLVGDGLRDALDPRLKRFVNKKYKVKKKNKNN